MRNRELFDIDDYVVEISEKVALMHDHPFYRHLIAMLAMEANLYAESQAIVEDEGILITNNGSQECVNPALMVGHKAAQNIIKLCKLLGLTRK